MFDEDFKDRISSHLNSKIDKDIQSGPGFFARNVMQAMRYLEDKPVAPSTRLMHMDERELKGKLSNIWHIHVAEDNMTGMYNFLRLKSEKPEKKQNEKDLIARGAREALRQYLLSRGRVLKSREIRELAAQCSACAADTDMEQFENEMRQSIDAIAKRSFAKENSISGDWLLYWKDVNGVRYYLDSIEHILGSDVQKQTNLSNGLDAILSSMGKSR